MANKGDIRKEEIQPNFPKRWDIIPFKNGLMKSGKFTKLKSSQYLETGIYPIIDQGEKFISGYIDDKNLIYDGILPIVIFGDHTRNIKFIDFPFAAGADGTKILAPVEDINPHFFYYYLKTLKIPSFGYSRHYKVFDFLDLPIPPLPEQQRIVAKLDALFRHLDSLREKLDLIPELLKNFRQQVLTQAVTGELTKEWREGKGLGEWEYIGLQEVADVVDPHPSHRTPPSVLDGVPYISIKDVDSKGRIDFKNSNLVSPKVLEEHIKRYELKDGDLGFGKIGTLGKPFRLPIFNERNYTLSANIILIQPKSNCNPKFLFYYLDSPIINKLLKEGAKATSQPAFGIKKARVFPTPSPSQEEQKEIVTQIDALFSLADKIESRYGSLKVKIDQMPQAILAKAFRGELVEREVKEYVVEEGEGLMAAEEQLRYRLKTKT